MTAIRSPLACFHPSNLLTYASLFASIAAVAAAVQKNVSLAGALITAAVVFDTLDGRYARRFERSADQKAVGSQLDSLSDAVSFGLAPAMCAVASWTPASGPLTLAWWVSVSLFAACAISRLAFYNVTHEHTDGFIGLPVPVAALLWSTVLLGNPGAAASIAVFLIAAAAMVLPLTIPRPHGLSLAAFLCWPLLVLAAHLA